MSKNEELAPTSTNLPEAELDPSSQAEVMAEVQGAIVVAQKIPRNEEKAIASIETSCRRPSFAEEAYYLYPRGGTEVSGPSIGLAREMARLWGNIRYGTMVVWEDDDERKIRCFAWDLQTNTYQSAEDLFKKLIYRKKGGWQKPDERDLRELTNRRAAILMRNCILALLPRDVIDRSVALAMEAVAKSSGSSEDDAQKSLHLLIRAFDALKVSQKQLEKHLGHSIDETTAQEIAQLRGVYKSIRDGHTTWNEYTGETEPDQPRPSGPQISIEDLEPSGDGPSEEEKAEIKAQEKAESENGSESDDLDEGKGVAAGDSDESDEDTEESLESEDEGDSEDRDDDAPLTEPQIRELAKLAVENGWDGGRADLETYALDQYELPLDEIPQFLYPDFYRVFSQEPE